MIYLIVGDFTALIDFFLSNTAASQLIEIAKS